MKKIYWLTLLFVSFMSCAGFANKNMVAGQISKNIDEALKTFGENINIGILVQDAKTGKVLYKRNADRYFMPASNEKLFTAFAALESFSPDFSYQTRLFADKTKVKNGILEDNIYIQFSGDPRLTSDQLEQLLGSLAQAEIKKIKGAVIIDDTAFDNEAMSPGTTWDDKAFCWGAPVSALMINQNCANATLVPASRPGQPAKLKLPDYPQPIRFINQVTTKAPATKDCAIKVKPEGDKTYAISGCIKTNAQPQNVAMAISGPRENTRLLVDYLLKKNHIQVSKKIEFRKMSFLTAEVFSKQDSLPFKALITTMLKESDNGIAESLFKTIGALYTHEAGSFINGNNAVRAILAEAAHLNFPPTTLIDGSGASRYNFITPEQIVALLQKAFYSDYAAYFISSLPVSGVDGTLKDRMKDPLTRGKVHAKTGSMSAVSSLSGYLETKTKRTLIFSIMINGFVDSPEKYKALEDKLCAILIKSS
ncbi:D-alanyl-D-alanine carboxypeptidase/D-alanyl-D-alanine-endopeptidase [Legionella feeleii]|uniref:D-Ala-D-Ala carboxypeptidase n=1 Tax=Legionella feeleii TaxID=453 RepID=A0A378IX55_9GAMM|nr:D-alanyl-D-alanine carboxypeptidase/D-alanyl-D-alanine-endopeptidase [Legionella feeleii]STX39175.1 D-Ala-D-Ala carboxypeptidase [Legionella feeleii]